MTIGKRLEGGIASLLILLDLLVTFKMLTHGSLLESLSDLVVKEQAYNSFVLPGQALQDGAGRPLTLTLTVGLRCNLEVGPVVLTFT